MFVKDNILYADAYKYLKHKTAPTVAMIVPLTNSTIGDYEEVSFKDPLDIEVKDNTIYWGNRLFLIKVKSLKYADVKTAIIKSRYSDDDQMSIILNRDKGEEKEVLYQKMQEWRDFAGYIAKTVNNL